MMETLEEEVRTIADSLFGDEGAPTLATTAADIEALLAAERFREARFSRWRSLIHHVRRIDRAPSMSLQRSGSRIQPHTALRYINNELCILLTFFRLRGPIRWSNLVHGGAA